MKRMLELNLGAMILLTLAVGCGGTSTDAGTGGASSAAGGPGSAGGAGNGSAGRSSTDPGAGGTPATPNGGSHAGGQTSNTGGSAPGGDFMTSVPGTTPLKDLTPDQLATLCSDAQKFAQASFAAPLTDFQCKAMALIAAAQATTDAAAQAECKAELGACTPADIGEGMCDSNVPATCTATVADLTVCYNDTSDAIAGLAGTVPSCDGMTLAQAKAALATLAASGNTAPMDPASCTKFDGECGSMTGTP